MKTLHIYSSSKIAVISLFRNHTRTFIFWLSLARNTETAQVVTRRWSFYFTKRN